jgi:multidrug transporter EmrE-like cation transporter
MWYKMMTVAFLTNGLGIFGTRVLTGWGWAEFYKFQYLVFWYGSGLLFALLLFWREKTGLARRDFVIGGLMGAASVGGQFSLLSALENGIPGHIAFPLANGGGLFLVALIGVIAFGERVRGYGIAGIILGIGATILLSLP